MSIEGPVPSQRDPAGDDLAHSRVRVTPEARVEHVVGGEFVLAAPERAERDALVEQRARPSGSVQVASEARVERVIGGKFSTPRPSAPSLKPLLTSALATSARTAGSASPPKRASSAS